MEILLVNVLLFQIQFLSYKTFINILITARKFYFARLLFMTLIYNFIINLYNVLQQYKIMGIKNSEKKIKIFEYLKTRSISMEQYSFKKHIPVKKTQKTRMANLKEQYSFRMEQLFQAFYSILRRKILCFRGKTNIQKWYIMLTRKKINEILLINIVRC